MKVYTATRASRMFFTASTLLLLLQWSSVAANFNITFTNFNFDRPNNTDAMGMCCNEREGRSNCSTPCNVTAYVCIPSNGSTFSNEGDQCPNGTLSRQLTADINYNIPHPWTGRLQLLICIEEDNGNRVATFEIEHNGTAAQPNDTELPEEAYTERDQNGAVLSISIYVQCNTGFYGPSCDCQNTNDSTGHYTCTREGGIQCLDGYQNPHNNCTELQMPGPTVSSSSDVSDTASTLDGMFTTSLAIMIDFMSTPVAFPSLLIDPVLTTTITAFTSSLSSMSNPSSLQGPPLTTPAPTQTDIEILTTPVVISTPTSISLTSSPLLSQSVTSGPFQTTTQPLLTTSLPLPTTSVQIQTTIEPSLTTVLPSLSATTTSLASSLTQTTFSTVQATTQEPEPTITASKEPSTTTTISIETALPLTTTQGPQTTISASVGTTSSTEPSSRSGNAAVIAGTVIVLTVVVASILVIAMCVYFVVKKKQKNSKLESIVYLDQVYNTPVTFVNPEHEGVSPRSPQLTMTVSGDQENGSHLEATHMPSFPSVDYRAHIPYAETGPSSDHTQSPANEEGSQVYQFQDGKTTIIANPHSWSRSSESPPPLPPPADFAAAAPASEQNNRKSGLELNDPIGGAKYSKHLPSAQSSRSEGGSRHTNSPHLTVPHLSPRGAPKTTRKPASSGSRGSGREGGLHKAAVPATPRDNSYEIRRSRDREEEEEGMQKRVNEYLQSAQEEGERRQSFMKDILFTDINLDMTTQTEL